MYQDERTLLASYAAARYNLPQHVLADEVMCITALE